MGSFRQLLLIAFMVIAALLGGTALRAVILLDQLMAQSGEEAARALSLNAAAQSLSARAAAMERAARQSLVLSDALLRRRFEEELAAAQGQLQQMTEQGLATDNASLWNRRTEHIAMLMNGPAATALDRERAIAGEFRELDSVNSRIAGQIQSLIAQRNSALARQLDASRVRMTQQVVIAIGLAVVLAVGLGVWLARPFKRLETAIQELGEDRTRGPINIPGPSDVRGVSQQLEWLRLRLTELDADKARFLRHVSHELKTPLAALREGVALLQDGVPGELNTGQREVVRILQQNALSLQGQIEALLRFNAAAFEARQLHRRKTDLLALLHEQVEAQRLQWQAHQLSVQVRGAPLSLPVDPSKLGTAIANLLSNAIRFSPAGGTVLLQLSAPSEGVRIDISDEGPGIAQADREHVFEPFYRGRRQPQDTVRGTGIGLSIVQEYVAAHGGRVELLSDSHGGHFRVQLPHAP